ncbi:hypothetical protein NDU88_000471 [Pleurodeles waltl]|uniref:Uncharacterized protein n=1 Tax=Pleurodeles waltl TaxID=8319 RepID=A0AAV7NCT6_PLEWA|nr:hypothetical protein NDU88_000471 [Pleurodeles waltl]
MRVKRVAAVAQGPVKTPGGAALNLRLSSAALREPRVLRKSVPVSHNVYIVYLLPAWDCHLHPPRERRLWRPCRLLPSSRNQQELYLQCSQMKEKESKFVNT